ncbi:helix-turn-helix domain-containing protein [Streptomyces roseoviridis]|uniref:Helix-turn-helix domain-containing protein n=1 Tax=Streptomyces roseoviridis TaxID=67361 RepID=A0ABV5QT02_9ACTN
MHLSVSRHPGTTLFSVLAGAFGDRPQGMPQSWNRIVRQSARPDDGAELRAVFTSGVPWLPDSLSLTRGVRDAAPGPHPRGVEEELDALDAEVLQQEIARRFGDAVPEHWRRIADRPRRFLDAYRRLAHSVWSAFCPLWRRADGLLLREAERVGVASVTGGLAPLLNTLGASVRYADGLLELPHACPSHLSDRGRRLVLAPLASGFSACAYSAEDPDLIWIGYPLPGLGQLTEGADTQPRRVSDPLETVLGPVRAAILRAARRGPSVSETARQAHVTVSTATYHCGQLARAGLLRRTRHGREVRLRLTDTGAALLDLLS